MSIHLTQKDVKTAKAVMDMCAEFDQNREQTAGHLMRAYRLQGLSEELAFEVVDVVLSSEYACQRVYPQ